MTRPGGISLHLSLLRGLVIAAGLCLPLSACGIPIILAMGALGMPWNAVEEIEPGNSIAMPEDEGLILVALSAGEAGYSISIEAYDMSANAVAQSCARHDYASVSYDRTDGKVDYSLFKVPPGHYVMGGVHYGNRGANLPSYAVAVEGGEVVYVGQFNLEKRGSEYGVDFPMAEIEVNESKAGEALRSLWGIEAMPEVANRIPVSPPGIGPLLCLP